LLKSTFCSEPLITCALPTLFLRTSFAAAA
jgi:hypothetical protein